ncbi:MAG: endolytic transglycosylase MltG [Ignavibacteria bacterium]|nr:endolytic transglycosylase MltG [Ignavibacteria bacterium]
MQKTPFRSLLTKTQWIVVIMVFAGILAALSYTFFKPHYYQGQGPKKITILPGESFSRVAEHFHKAGIIPSTRNFKIAAYLMGGSLRIQAGRYSIENGMSYIQLVQYLISGNADRAKTVLIYGGSSFKKIGERLQQEGIIEQEKFVLYAKNGNLAARYGYNTGSLLGYLLPGTYIFFEHSTPEEIVDTLALSFKRFADEGLLKQVRQSGRSLHQILTMASIVDWETSNTSEMPKIAGVYYNRLRIGMRLQADPTIQFIRTDGWGRVKGEPLHIKSPYNTYLNPGLPPGPINNPGKDAIMAAIYPEKHQFLFFVAGFKGHHVFSRTYTEHKQHAKEYYKWLNSLEKKKEEAK